nr:SUMF1/EgtB/PvdO family nonheme iron enzyme [uncultured Massilia sp.]
MYQQRRSVPAQRCPAAIGQRAFLIIHIYEVTMRLSTFTLLACVGLFALDARAADPAPANASLDARIQALVKKVQKTMRPLKGGTFDMGDWGGKTGLPYDMDGHSKPLHKVTLDGFSMMAYKVTYEDFDVFTDATGKERIGMGDLLIRHRAPRRPAGVNWYGAKEYCMWLAKVTKLPFDLPTEAQWEYAARSGGKRVLFSTDNGKLERPRNFPNDWKDGPEPPLPNVGSFPPNPAGLYGMSENTFEWVLDWFDKSYYKVSPEKNPLGPVKGTEKVQRGTVGGKAEIASMVFMRTKSAPSPQYEGFPNGVESGAVLVSFPGYSSFNGYNFRCAFNSSKIY